MILASHCEEVQTRVLTVVLLIEALYNTERRLCSTQQHTRVCTLAYLVLMFYFYTLHVYETSAEWHRCEEENISLNTVSGVVWPDVWTLRGSLIMCCWSTRPSVWWKIHSVIALHLLWFDLAFRRNNAAVECSGPRSRALSWTLQPHGPHKSHLTVMYTRPRSLSLDPPEPRSAVIHRRMDFHLRVDTLNSPVSVWPYLWKHEQSETAPLTVRSLFISVCLELCVFWILFCYRILCCLGLMWFDDVKWRYTYSVLFLDVWCSSSFLLSYRQLKHTVRTSWLFTVRKLVGRIMKHPWCMWTVSSSKSLYPPAFWLANSDRFHIKWIK